MTGLPRRFSFACFPAERVAVLAGMVAGPGIAVAFLQRLAESSGRADTSIADVLANSASSARLFAGAALLLALALVVYGALYLQWRAGASLDIDDRGFRWRRRAVLPGGGAHVERSWTAVNRVALLERRSLLGRNALLVAEWPGGQLRLSVPDAWPEDAGARPWLPQRPNGGWAEHPLPASAIEAWQKAREARPETVAASKT